MRTRGKAASGRRAQPEPAKIVVQHHFLVRLTHWLNVPILAGLIVSGLAIYWAAPVFRHAPDPRTGSTDYLADLGAWIVAHVPGAKGTTPGTWIYDHFSIGTAELARALRLHWFFAYAFMATGLLYGIGLLLGGGFRDLLPRRGDVRQALAMMRYYAGFLPAKLARRPWPHPPVAGKYNALQRAAYLAIPLCGVLSILSGWAMHKPVQLVWLERLFVNYDGARIVHFFCMIVLAGFVIPHAVLVVAAGWNVFRSMVTGWAIPEAISEPIPEPEVSHEES
jgi:thiosulfate reductase cytochrome b subunit